MTGFTPEVRAQIRDGSIRSAAVIAEMLLAEFPQAWGGRVIDVGCGEGWFAGAFRDIAGCPVLGVDHPETEFLALDPPDVLRWDLRVPLPGLAQGPGFDLAVCLEVAEHLPAERAVTLIAELCSLAPIVAFSAAIPGQGGTGHINEQPPGYWAALFAEHDYDASGYLRWRLWDDDRVENWYRQNLLIAVNRAWADYSTVPSFAADLPPRHVVHPVLWDARRPR